MKLAVMQPYFLPYIGYFQMFTAVDRYVIFDDVNFIKAGWIHRNRLLCQGQVQYFGISVAGASQNKKINEHLLARDEKTVGKTLRTIAQSYAKAPNFGEIMPLIEKIYASDEENLARFLRESIETVLARLEITTPLCFSSEYPNPELHGTERILDLCERLGADTYLNAIGGRALYREENFAERGLRLGFLQTGEVRDDQGHEPFEPNRSILDLLMRCSPEELREQLRNYEIISADGTAWPRE